MTMHPYGFVLPIGYSWAKAGEGTHQLLCRCDAGWSWKDADLRHVPAQALIDLARRHEEAVHAPPRMKVGLRTAPAGGNCLGGDIELPSRWIDDIPVQLQRGRGQQGLVPVIPRHYDGVELESGKWVDTPGGVLPYSEAASLTGPELARLRELGIKVPQKALPRDAPDSGPLTPGPQGPEEPSDAPRGPKGWVRTVVDRVMGWHDEKPETD